MLGQRLDDDRQVRVAFHHPEDERAAHAVERFQHGVLVLCLEFPDHVGAARDDQRRTALRKRGREELLVAVAQAAGPIDDEHAVVSRARSSR